MNDLLTNNNLEPKKAIIVYSTKGQWNRDYYLEERAIQRTKSGFTFNAAIPLAENTLKDIAKTFIKSRGGEMHHEPIVGEHVLHASISPGNLLILWYRPSQERKLNFAKYLKIEPLTAKLPAILHVLHNGTMYAFALAVNKRPDIDTKLYRAPFYNVYEDARICLGSANVGKVVQETFEQELWRYERGFYLAEMNTLHQKNPTKTELNKFWRLHVRSGRPFPKEELIAHPKFKTLNAILTAYNK